MTFYLSFYWLIPFIKKFFRERMYKSTQSSSLLDDEDPLKSLDNFIDESLLEKTW